MTYFIVICILLLTCCTKSFQYEIDKIKSEKQNYRSTRLRFSESNYKEMEFELLFFSKKIKGFLNFYHSTINEKKDGFIRVSVDDKIFSDKCICMKGNQRILLSEEITKIIIDSLNSGKKISIIHNKSTININEKEFEQAYQKVVKDKSIISTFLNIIK